MSIFKITLESLANAVIACPRPHKNKYKMDRGPLIAPESGHDHLDTPFEQITLPDIESLSIHDLLRLRSRIDGALPSVTLSRVDLTQDLLRQKVALEFLQSETMGDRTYQLNQRAQVANALSGVLAQIAKAQMEVYTSERMKRLENVLIECVQTLPKDVVAAFWDLYEKKVGNV